MPKQLGIITERFAQPFFRELRSGRDFSVIEETPARLAVKLRRSQIDGALLSLVDYAKDYSMYRVVPTVALVSERESNIAGLFFKQHLRDLRTIAVNPNFSSEIVLATLVLKEQYDITPTIIPSARPFNEALQQADAVLCVGDEYLHASHHTQRIDLVQEWHELTELPFVHGVWIAREQALTMPERQALIASCQKAPEYHLLFSDNRFPHLFDHVRYELDQSALESMKEFLRMAYYHGILQDITEMRFHDIEEKTSNSRLSLN